MPVWVKPPVDEAVLTQSHSVAWPTFNMRVVVAMPHVVEIVYLTKVEPLLTAVTKPVELIVAMAVLSLLQVPPDGALVSIDVWPMHNMPLPVIASGGVGLMVRLFTA